MKKLFRGLLAGLLVGGLLSQVRPAAASELMPQWTLQDAQAHIKEAYEHAETMLFAFPRYTDYQYIFRVGIERALIDARIVAKRYGLSFDRDREYNIYSSLAKIDPEKTSIRVEEQMLKKLLDKYQYLENAYRNGDEKLATQLSNELGVKVEPEKLAKEKRNLSSWKTASSYAEWMAHEKALLDRSKAFDHLNVQALIKRLEEQPDMDMGKPDMDMGEIDPNVYIRDFVEDHIHQLAFLDYRLGGQAVSPTEVGKLQLSAYERLRDHFENLPPHHRHRHGLKLVNKKIQYLQYLKHHNKSNNK